MADAPGTTTLTPEQQQWFIDKYGVRYVAVEDGTKGVYNRKQRRKLARTKP